MIEFRTVPLNGLLEELLDYRGKSPPKAQSGIPVVSAKVVKDGRILTSIEQKIAPDFYPRWMVRGLPQVGDVILTTEGPLGEVAQLDSQTVKYALGQRVVTLRGRPKVLDNTFLKFLLMSPRQQEVLASYATGTTVAGISQKALRAVPVTIPDYDEQVRIGALLGALDDKIALNRQMNTSLEAMARALFRDWFLDYGPTRAKIEECKAYLRPEVWSLFPGELEPDGHPRGWNRGTLGDVAWQVGEVVDPETLDPSTPYIGLEHMPRRSLALQEWDGAGKVTSGKLAFRRFNCLFGKLRPYFHKVGIAPVDGICSTDIVVMEAKKPEAHSFVIGCVFQDEFVAYTDRTSDGTKMPRTSWGRMEKYPLCIPPPSILKAFDIAVAPLFERIAANVHESRRLLETRDYILPKLLCGEIRVHKAPMMAEAVL